MQGWGDLEGGVVSVAGEGGELHSQVSTVGRVAVRSVGGNDEID